MKIKGLSKRFFPVDKDGGLRSALRFLLSGNNQQGGRLALDDVSFSLKEGQALGIVGRNGSGKTTLLRLLASVYEPTAGELDLPKEVCALLDLTSGIREELTGSDILDTLAILAGWTPAQLSQKRQEMVDFSGLGERLQEPCRTYSSGMLLRLAFSVAVARRPELMLVDEVFAVGDKTFARSCQEKISAYRRQGTAVVFASHDLDFITKTCGSCLWLEGGKVAALGPAGSVVSQYRSFLAEQTTSALKPVEVAHNRAPQKKSPFGSVTFRNETGANNAFAVGTPIKVDIPILQEEDLGPLIFGVALKSSDGQLLWGSNTKRENMDLLTFPYCHNICLELSGGELQPGEYCLDLCLSDPDENPVFYETDCGRFGILELEGTGQEGLFRPRHKFTISSVEMKSKSTVQ